MAVTGAAIAAKQAGGNPIKRVGAYIRAHWKELLALTLAAIPALFLVFHAGARKQAQEILTLPPLGAAPSSAGSDTSSAQTPPILTSPAPSSSGPSKTSINGYNPISVPAPDKGTAPTVEKKVSPPPAPPVKTFTKGPWRGLTAAQRNAALSNSAPPPPAPKDPHHGPQAGALE